MAHESAASNLTVVHSSPLQPKLFISTTVPAEDLNKDIMDVAFVNSVGSYPGGEEELRKVHRFGDSVPLGKHWSYKYLIDLDGMSYSGRFLALLASDSAVVKSTVYKEYFSDWLQPWYVAFQRSFFSHGGIGVDLLQAALYTPLFVVFGDLQHPCVFFGTVDVDDERRQRDGVADRRLGGS